jgi:hypothetical protein
MWLLPRRARAACPHLVSPVVLAIGAIDIDTSIHLPQSPAIALGREIRMHRPSQIVQVWTLRPRRMRMGSNQLCRRGTRNSTELGKENRSNNKQAAAEQEPLSTHYVMPPAVSRACIGSRCLLPYQILQALYYSGIAIQQYRCAKEYMRCREPILHAGLWPLAPK